MYNHNEWLRRKNERRGSDPGLIGKLPQLPLSVLHSPHTFTRSYIQMIYLSLLRSPSLFPPFPRATSSLLFQYRQEDRGLRNGAESSKRTGRPEKYPRAYARAHTNARHSKQRHSTEAIQSLEKEKKTRFNAHGRVDCRGSKPRTNDTAIHLYNLLT